MEQERAELPVLRGFASQAESAMNAGNIDERAYVDLVSANYAKQQAVLTLEQLLLEQEVASPRSSGPECRALPCRRKLLTRN